MKTFFFSSTLLAAACFFSSGCNDTHAEHAHAHATEEAPASVYKAGHGLQLAPKAAQFLGLKTADFSGGRLPRAVVLRTVKGDFVYVANGGWFLRTPVKVAGTDAEGFEVKDGLYEGDAIVTTGVEGLWLAELQAINGGVGCAHGH